MFFVLHNWTQLKWVKFKTMVPNKKLQNLAQYIAVSNPSGVKELAGKFNYPVPRSNEGTLGFIYKLVSEKGDKGIEKLIEIHPDREVILASFKSSKIAENFIGDVKFVGEPQEQKFTLMHVGIIFIVAILVIAVINGKL